MGRPAFNILVFFSLKKVGIRSIFRIPNANPFLFIEPYVNVTFRPISYFLLLLLWLLLFILVCHSKIPLLFNEESLFPFVKPPYLNFGKLHFSQTQAYRPRPKVSPDVFKSGQRCTGCAQVIFYNFDRKYI